VKTDTNVLRIILTRRGLQVDKQAVTWVNVRARVSILKKGFTFNASFPDVLVELILDELLSKIIDCALKRSLLCAHISSFTG